LRLLNSPKTHFRKTKQTSNRGKSTTESYRTQWQFLLTIAKELVPPETNASFTVTTDLSPIGLFDVNFGSAETAEESIDVPNGTGGTAGSAR
jgi:hypothetical protein